MSKSKKSKKSRPAAPRRNLGLESLENRVVFSADSPVAVNDLFHALPDQSFEAPAPGVFANDTIVGCDPSAQLFSGPAHGALDLRADGSFEYVPETGFEGIDSFVYRATAGGKSSGLAAVTMLVEQPQNAPVSVNDAYEMDEDGSLDIAAESGVLANDTDADGDALTSTLMSGPANGTVTLNADGSFNYTPNANFHGIDGFSYLTSDDALSSSVATVTIDVSEVNDVPVASNDEFTTDEDSPLTIDAAGVLANDTDADGDTLTATLEEGPANGTVALNSDGSFTYTPNANFHGVDAFSYVVSDGQAESDVAAVTINVNSVNDVPVAANDEFTTDEDTPLTIDPAGLLVNDSDADGDTLTTTLEEGPANGTVVLNSDGSFTYTPNANFHGVDAFSYVVSDGQAESDVAAVTINVNSVNDVPVAANDEFTTDEDVPLTIDPAGLLANDTDADGDTLTAAIQDGPANGTVVLNADGTFTYTPNANFYGVDTFSYVVSDGQAESDAATVTINVNPVNDVPVAANDEFTTDEDVPLTIDPAGMLANDTDADGDTLTATIQEGPANGTVALNADGTFTYTPNANFYGVDTFTYVVSDGQAESEAATVTINVNPVNDAPVAAEDGYLAISGQPLTVDAAGGVLANDSDIEGEPLEASLVCELEHGTLALNADGSFTYTSEEGYVGDDSFTYQVSDGAACSDPVAVSISVGAAQVEVNTRPEAANDRYTVEAGGTLTVEGAGVMANDTDAEGAPLAASLHAPPRHGTLDFHSDGSFVYQPNPGFVGRDSFMYRVSDGTLASAFAAVTLYVQAPAAPPVDVPVEQPVEEPDEEPCLAPIAQPVPTPSDTRSDEPEENVCEPVAKPPCEPDAVAAAEHCGGLRVQVGIAIEGLLAAHLSHGHHHHHHHDHVDLLFSGRGWWR